MTVIQLMLVEVHGKKVSWEVVDINGTIVLSGGLPYSGTLCFPQIFGCTDPIATITIH